MVSFVEGFQPFWRASIALVIVSALAAAPPSRLCFSISDGAQPGGWGASPAQWVCFSELFLASEIKWLMACSSTLTVIFVFWSSSLLTVLHYVYITFVTLGSDGVSASQSDFGSCHCARGGKKSCHEREIRLFTGIPFIQLAQRIEEQSFDTFCLFPCVLLQ